MSVCCEGGSLQFLPVFLLPVEHGLAKNKFQCWRSSLREMHLKHLHSRCLGRGLRPGQQGWQRGGILKGQRALPGPSCARGHRPAWNCCSFMGLLLAPEIAPESQAVRHLWAQQDVTNTGETIKLVSKNEIGDSVDSLPRSGAQCVCYQKISRFLLSEGAPNPLLLGQFHISSHWQQEWSVPWLDSLVPVHAVDWNLIRKIVSLKKVLPFWQHRTVQQLVSRTENLSSH